MNYQHAEVATLDPQTMQTLCEEYIANNYIDPETSERLGVKRGLRNPDGTGVLAGLTNVCDVVGYKKDQEGHVIPIPGKLIYRGVNIEEIVEEAYRNDRFVFEEVIWLLLFGSLPTQTQLDDFCALLAEHRALPDGFMDTMNAPSPNVMNKMQRCVLGLYSYDEHAEDLSLENILNQSINLIASMPTMMVNAYQMKRRYYDKQSMFFHLPKPGQSTAEHILSTYRPDQKFTHEEAKLLDMCLLVHADHGGGNCSTFTTRVLSSSGTDTYSAIAAAIGALKGPKHGGANLMVNRQLQDILKHVEHPDDDDEVREYLRRILRKQAGDGSGLIYGMGAQKLAQELKISTTQAKDFIARYFERLQGLKEFYEGVEASARKHGFVTTLGGRRRLLPDINSASGQAAALARRQAINTVIQGSAADIIKLAMLAVARDERLRELDARLLLQVHDELLLEVPADAAEEAGALVARLMQDVCPAGKELSVPLLVDWGTGHDWGAAH